MRNSVSSSANKLKGVGVAAARSSMASDASGHLGPCLMGHRLLEYGAPFVLLQMAKYMADRVRRRGRDLDLVEVFSGKGELSKSFAEAGCKVASYEILENPKLCDLSSDVGFLHAVGLVPLCQKCLVSSVVLLLVSVAEHWTRIWDGGLLARSCA